MMEYADIGIVKRLLNLDIRHRDPVYMVIPGVDVEAALEKAKRADVVKVTRCGNCFWCVQSRSPRSPLCTVPGRPAYHTDLNGFCNQAKEKGGNRNG